MKRVRQRVGLQAMYCILYLADIFLSLRSVKQCVSRSFLYFYAAAIYSISFRGKIRYRHRVIQK